MTPQTVAMLCSAAGRLDVTGNCYKAAMYWFKKNHAEGFYKFAKCEAMERWEFSGKIYRYVAEHGVIPTIHAVPEIKTQCEGVNQVLAWLNSNDSSTMQEIDGTIVKLNESKAYPEMVFLSKVRNRFNIDVGEIKAVADMVETDTALSLSNSYLLNKY